MATITLRVKGKKGAISFDTFLHVMNNSFDIIRDLDSAISEMPHGSMDWIVTKVSFRSLAMELSSKPRNVEKDYGYQIVDGYVGGLKLLQKQEITPPYFSDSSLKKVQSIASRLDNEGAESLEIKGNNKRSNVVEFSKKMQETTAKLIGHSYASYGSIEGTLEMISIHRQPRFNIYHNVLMRAVACTMPEELAEKVKGGLGRRVIATGMISYNAKDEPISVKLEDLEIIPIEDDLPSIEEFVGSDPFFTDDMSTADYIRSIRSV